jgi:hypothetical protein
VVIVRGEGLDLLARCVLARIQQLQRRERMSVARESQLYALVLAARMFAREHECAEPVPPQRGSRGQGDDDLVTVAEAAALSGYSEQHIRRLARSGQGIRIGSTWAITKGAALAIAEQREWKQRNGSRRVSGELGTGSAETGCGRIAG